MKRNADLDKYKVVAKLNYRKKLIEQNSKY